MNLKINDAAPDFTLYNTEKQSVKLSELKGKNVLLLFFPLAFTGVCTKELCTIRDDIQRYNDSNCTVLGISIDTLFVLEQFKKQQNIQFDLLSDFNKTTAKAYDVLYDVFPAFEMEGVAKRSVFLLDKEGRIQYIEVCPSPGDLPDFEAINAKLATL